MPRYAIVSQNLVTNTVIAGPGYIAADANSVAIASDTANIGDSYISGVFTAATPPPLSTAQLIAYANLRAASHEGGGISVDIGTSGSPQLVECATDNATYLRLMAANNYALANPAVTQVYPFPSGNVTLNATQIQTIYNAITTFYINCVNALAAVCAAIQGNTITTPAQIDAAAWPANS